MKDKLKGENPSTRYSELKHLSNCLKKPQERLRVKAIKISKGQTNFIRHGDPSSRP